LLKVRLGLGGVSTSVNVRWLSTGLIILAASLALSISPLLAAGKLDVVAKFQQANLELDVATYTETESKPSKVGLLGLAAGTFRNSFAFNAQEWPNLIAAVAKAAKAQSAGNNWTVVAKLTETGTTDVSHLVVSAGPGIRFALNSQKGASLTYVIAKSDIPRLQQGLIRVRQYFAAP
jgi:hypothetical protein